MMALHCMTAKSWQARRQALTAITAGLLLGLASGLQAATVEWDGGTASVNTTTGGNTNVGANWGALGGGANGAGGSVPGSADEVHLQDVSDTLPATRTVTLNAAATWQSLNLVQSSATGNNVFYVGVGGNSLNLTSATPLTITGAAGATAKLDLTGGNTVALSNAAAKAVSFGPGTILAGNAVGSGQGLYNTAAAATTFNFTGGTISTGASGVNLGGGAGSSNNNIVNLAAAIGPAASTSNLLKLQNVSNLNLNWTGSLDLGATVARRDTGTGTAVTIANSATGLSGGLVYGSHVATGTFPSGLGNFGPSSLTFASGGTGFNLSGGVIDVRANTAASGVITQNNTPLTVGGGGLYGNSLASNAGTPASLTVSGGELALRNDTADYTIAAGGGLDNRTVNLAGGTFSVNRASGSNNTIAIPAQASGGTWNLGTVNAGARYTIINGFASSFATYAVADNSGLSGLAMGANAIPATLTLGSGSSFLVASSTAPARTYNVGTGGGDDIQAPASGSFSFGITNSANAQVINLNRDKGADDILLVSNGNTVANTINIATDQTGAGSLTLNGRFVNLNAGVTVGGTGAIRQSGGLANNAGTVNSSGASTTALTIGGTINGTNTISVAVSENAGNQIILASTAVIGGTQNWTLANNNAVSSQAFQNQITVPSQWSNGSVTLNVTSGGASIEAATSTVNPSLASNFRFAAINVASGNGGQGHTLGRFRNAVQNDGGGGKEAVYASAWNFAGMSDSSGGHYELDLNGQDMYVDRFNNVTNATSRSLQFANHALGSTSTIRALGTTGDTLNGGSFMVTNGATLEVVGGNWNDIVYSRHVGTSVPADTAAAPNSITSLNVDTTRMWNNATGSAAAMIHFLGSGTDAGGNTGTAYAGTNGSIRIVGGNYSTSGYILNPLGTVGLIDTTSTNPNYLDSALNTVTIRGNTASDSGGVGNTTTFPALIVAGSTTINGHLLMANATGAANQATLRVGGVTASLMPVANGTATLAVVGNLTTESNTNLALQANGTLKVGGNVSIAGVGVNLANNVTGLGVGIDAASSFTLNGNSGAGTPQMVDIAPTVGNFHIGDGVGGTLVGTAAQAKLAANLMAAGNVDVNGAASSLNLDAYTLALGPGAALTVGGTLSGIGSITGGTTSVLAGGTLAPGNSPGSLTTADLLLDNAAILSFELGDPANPAASDHVRVIGDLTLDGILMVIPLTGFIHLPMVPSEYVLFDYDNLAADNGVTLSSSRFSIYTTTGIGEGAGQVILQYIPEPTSALLLGLLAAVGLRRRRCLVA